MLRHLPILFKFMFPPLQGEGQGGDGFCRSFEPTPILTFPLRGKEFKSGCIGSTQHVLLALTVQGGLPILNL